MGRHATRAELDALETELQQAVDHALNTRSGTYQRVNVIFCHFSNDNRSLSLHNELAKTFKELYGFNIIRWTMWATGKSDPNSLFLKFLAGIIGTDRGAEGSLIIVVFSGYGRMEGRPGYLRIGGAVDCWGDISGKTVDWSAVSAVLASSKADIVHILDCCHTIEAAHPSVEILGACAGSGAVEKTEEISFLEAVNRLLRVWGSRGPMTVATLYARLVRFQQVRRMKYDPFYVGRLDLPSISIEKMGSCGNAQTPVDNHW